LQKKLKKFVKLPKKLKKSKIYWYISKPFFW